MASLSAELRVNAHSYPLTDCRFGLHQDTGARGRVSAKVRHEPVQLTLDVPDDFLLPAWAADPHKRQPAAIVFRDAASGSALETLSLPAAYCVHYGEDFVHGDAGSGSYQATVVLSDPSGYTLQAGGPAAAFVAPQAREHGSPPVAAATRWKGWAGPDNAGSIIGKFSGRRFDPDKCGGPIINAVWQDAVIGKSGIAKVQTHLSRYGDDPENGAMLERLRKINKGQLAATDWDKRFYTHELREYERYQVLGVADGTDPGREVWNNAHTATLEDFGLSDYTVDGVHTLYHPEI